LTFNPVLPFDDPAQFDNLASASDSELDQLSFGVIAFDAEGLVQRYNKFESEAAGLSPPRVLQHPLFTLVAPCMNNYLVAQRFEDALVHATPLDAVIDYVLTLRMRPTKVKLRLLSTPGLVLRYVLVHRLR
jgi:photoactive yellow protein